MHPPSSNNKNKDNSQGPAPNDHLASAQVASPVAAATPSVQDAPDDLAAAVAYWNGLIQAAAASQANGDVAQHQQQSQLQSSGSSMSTAPSFDSPAGGGTTTTASSIRAASMMPLPLFFGDRMSAPNTQANNFKAWAGQPLRPTLRQQVTRLQLPTVQNLDPLNRMFPIPVHATLPQQQLSAGTVPNHPSVAATVTASGALPLFPQYSLGLTSNTATAAQANNHHQLVQNIVSMMGLTGPSSVAATSQWNSDSTPSYQITTAARKALDPKKNELKQHEGSEERHQLRHDEEPPLKRQRNNENDESYRNLDEEVNNHDSTLPPLPALEDNNPDQSPESQLNMDSEVESDRASSNSNSTAADISVASVHDIQEDSDEDAPADIEAMLLANGPNYSNMAGKNVTTSASTREFLELSPANDMRKEPHEKSESTNNQRNPTIEVVSYFISQTNGGNTKSKKPIKNINRKPLANRPWHDPLHHKMIRRNMVAIIERRIRQLMKNKISNGSLSVESSLSSDSDNNFRAVGLEDSIDTNKQAVIEHSLETRSDLHRSRSSSSPSSKKKKNPILLQRPAWLAQAIENRLYSAAQSFAEYAEKETLEERVRTAALVSRWRLDRVIRSDVDSVTSPSS